jgi:hypothetical protein
LKVSPELNCLSNTDVTGFKMSAASTSPRSSCPSCSVGLELAELQDDVADSLRVAGVEGDLGPISSHPTIEDCLRKGGAA